MTFAKRTNWDHHANALSRAIDELKLNGITILDLTESNPTKCGFDYPNDFVKALADPKNLHYEPDARGMQSARSAVGRFCQYDASQITLTASTSESYSFLCRLLLEPGDKVLIPRPSYPLFQFLLEINAPLPLLITQRIIIEHHIIDL